MKILPVPLMLVILLVGEFCLTPVNGQSAAMKVPMVGALPDKMQMHGTAIVGNRIYIFGGDLAGGANATLWTDKVNSARINHQTCVLEDWQEEENLPDMRAYVNNLVEVVNDRIYVVGGTTATSATEEKSAQRTSSVAWGQVDSAGRLKNWKTSPGPSQAPVLMSATCSSDKSLFVTGGQRANGSASGDILAADFSPVGELINWHTVGQLPTGLYNHGACIQYGRLYVWGGVTGPGKNNERVVSAAIGDTGSLGAWRDEAPMPEPIYGSACCGINDYLVSIGGRYKGSIPTNDIWFARLDGTEVKSWQKVSSDLQARVYHSLGLYKDKGWVFVTGGMNKTSPALNNGTIVNVVQAFQIPQVSGDQLRLNTAVGSGLMDMEKALVQAEKEKKNVLAFFYSPAVPACKRFWDNVSTMPAFKILADKYVMASVNTSGVDTMWMYKLRVFKVPCLVVVSPDGRAVKSSVRLETIEDVESFLRD